MLDYVRNVDVHVRDCMRGRHGVCMEVYVWKCMYGSVCRHGV